MKRDTRDRLVLPILLPLGILAAVGLALWGFSRVLLGVHGTPATAVALIVAGAIVGLSAFAAARPQVRGSTIAALVGGVAGVAMFAGGIAIAVVGGPEGEGGPGPGPGAPIPLVAANIAFEPKSLRVPAGVPFTIGFDNRDAVQHNVQIFDTPDFSGTPLFDGTIVTGPIRTDYEVSPLAAGTYFFRCVVHPANMTGEIHAAEPGGAGGGPGGGVRVSAQNIEFDTDLIELPADVPATILFDNRDAGVQHNISIYSDSSLGEQLFKGDLVTGPTTTEYPIPPQPAGEYYFQCDVHPTMNGSVVVAGAGGPGPGGATGGTGGTGSTGATGPSP